jgi:hypothetical protein
MSESIKVSISIAGRAYPLIIEKKEELMVKELESKINDTFNKIQVMYQMSDKVDNLAMTIISLLMEAEQSNNNVAPQEDVTDVLQRLETMLG